MSSRIDRMFQAARNTVKAYPSDGRIEWRDRGRIENFLTELIALATMEHPETLVRLLALRGVGAPAAAAVPAALETQYGFLDEDGKTRRSIDLIVRMTEEAGRRAEIWVEVKAGSPFHGSQLDAYAAAVARLREGGAEDDEPPLDARLIVLGPSWLQGPELSTRGIPLVTWDEFVQEARVSASNLWRELGAFVEEQGTAVNDGLLSSPRLLV